MAAHRSWIPQFHQAAECAFAIGGCRIDQNSGHDARAQLARSVFCRVREFKIVRATHQRLFVEHVCRLKRNFHAPTETTRTTNRYAEVLRPDRGTLGSDHGALCRVPRHRQPRPCREPGSAVHIQTRQPVQVLAGTKPRSSIKPTPVEDQLEEHEQQWRQAMIQRALASKGLVAYVLACATGITLYFRWPFPENDLMLNLISIRAPLIYAGFKYTYTLFLFTTPYIGYSLVLSGLYVFAFRSNRRIKPMPLPAYPEPTRRDELFLVLGEVHDPRKPLPPHHPYCLPFPKPHPSTP